MGMSIDLAELGSLRLVSPLKDIRYPRRRSLWQKLSNPENRLHLQTEDALCRQQCGTEHRLEQERDDFRRYDHLARQWQRWLVQIKRESE